MFDVGWTELVVIACVAILVVGPKDLPRMLRAFGKTMAGVRRIAGDFRRQFDEAMRESELADIAKETSSIKNFQPLEDARKTMVEAQKSIKDSIEGSAAEIKSAAGSLTAAEGEGTPKAPVAEGKAAEVEAKVDPAPAIVPAPPEPAPPEPATKAKKSAKKSAGNGAAPAKDAAP